MEPVLIMSNVFLWLVVLLNLLLTLALIRRGKSEQNSVLQPGLGRGQEAPDFTAQTLDGVTVHLSTYAGRRVAFLFITTHCHPCREAAYDFAALLPKAVQVGVELVLVSASDVQETQAFVEELDLHLPVLVAPRFSSSFFKDYKADSTPSYCVVNEQRKVHATGHPGLNGGVRKVLTDFWMMGEQKAISSTRR